MQVAGLTLPEGGDEGEAEFRVVGLLYGEVGHHPPTDEPHYGAPHLGTVFQKLEFRASRYY